MKTLVFQIFGCGIEGVSTTSLSREVGQEVSVSETRPILLNAFSENFECLLDECSTSKTASVSSS